MEGQYVHEVEENNKLEVIEEDSLDEDLSIGEELEPQDIDEFF